MKTGERVSGTTVSFHVLYWGAWANAVLTFSFVFWMFFWCSWLSSWLLIWRWLLLAWVFSVFPFVWYKVLFTAEFPVGEAALLSFTFTPREQALCICLGWEQAIYNSQIHYEDNNGNMSIIILCSDMFVWSLNYYNMYDLRQEVVLFFFYLRYVTAREQNHGSWMLMQT